MRVKFHCDNQANVYSKFTEEFEMKDLGMTDEEWKELTEDEKNELLKEWALERYEYWFEEIP